MPQSIDQLIQQALKLHEAHQYVQAESLYKQALAASPNNAKAIHLLGLLYSETARYDAALPLMTQSIQLAPQVPQFYNNLGEVYRARREFDKAVDNYHKALQRKPNFPEALNNLGLALSNLDRLAEAESALRKAIALDPELAQPHNNLAAVLLQQDKLDECISECNVALRLKPDYAKAASNMAQALLRGGRVAAAASIGKRAIDLDPKSATAYQAVAGASLDAGSVDDAINFFKQSVQLQPDYFEGWHNFLLAINYHPGIDGAAILKEHLSFADQVHAWMKRNGKSPRTHFANSLDPHRRLRVGYVSADFRNHAVSYFIEPILANHDHEHFDIFCYADVPRPDDVTARLQKHADHWRPTASLTDDQLESLIVSDQVDLLIDLHAHSSGTRLPIFARRPAPIQLTYLGYPGTTGLAEIDYKITDRYIDPPSLPETFHSEKLLRLPHSYFCYLPPPNAPDIGPLPALSNGHITFGCFNTLAKINPTMIATWCRALVAVPNSTMIIQSAVGLSDPSARAQLQFQFSQHNIAPERLILRGNTDFQTYLKNLEQIDITLDTYPFNGGTTSCHALWMSSPLITLSGPTSVSRMGASLLSNIRLPDLIAHSPDQFESIASSFAADLPRLSELRRTMRDRIKQSPLMNAPQHTRELENSLQHAWRSWCASTPS